MLFKYEYKIGMINQDFYQYIICVAKNKREAIKKMTDTLTDQMDSMFGENSMGGPINGYDEVLDEIIVDMKKNIKPFKFYDNGTYVGEIDDRAAIDLDI